jgi:hypothetical protein
MPKKNKYELERVQRRAARFVSGRYHNTSNVSDMMSNLNWETLEQRRMRARVTMFYKITNNVVVTSLFCLVCGDHTVEQYSRFDPTIPLYAFSFVVSFLTFMFLRINPSNLLAFPVMLHMWVFHVRSLESVTPKYLASLTSS